MEEIAKKIKSSKKVAIFCHIGPDPDTVGSTLALKRILKSMGKEAYAFSSDKLPSDFEFVSSIEKFDNFENGQTLKDFDLLVSVDISSIDRIGVFQDDFKNHENTIKIDHHENSDNFAKINYVEENSSATAIIIFKLAEKLKAKIDKETATLLYFGICGDTGVFKFNNTDSATFYTAYKLAELQADIQKVYLEFFDKYKVSKVQVRSKALLDAKFYNGFVIMQVSKKVYKKYGTTPEECDIGNLPNTYLNAGYKIGAILKQHSDCIRVSLRSKKDYDVSKIAESFGGGGHKNSAGYTTYGSMKVAERKLKQKLEKYLEEEYAE